MSTIPDIIHNLKVVREALEHEGLAVHVKLIDQTIEDLAVGWRAEDVKDAAPQTVLPTIDTAPRDGTHILAWRIPVGIRVTNNTHPPTTVHWFDDPDEPGFYTSVNERAPEHPFEATHWLPLPVFPLSRPLREAGK